MLAMLHSPTCEQEPEQSADSPSLHICRAQGAAQALEDAAVLGALFAKAQNKDEIKDALDIYERLRKPRTSRVVQESSRYGAVMHLPDGEGQIERDRQMTDHEPFEGYPNRWADPVFQNYLFGYDADAVAAEAWNQYKAGKERT
jgi:salicylate hydroxylase